ncbi:MAG TPA: hypothetical protein VF599_13560 [Pyrinomonadaceae bacterium]|jgi:spore germination protein GerM
MKTRVSRKSLLLFALAYGILPAVFYPAAVNAQTTHSRRSSTKIKLYFPPRKDWDYNVVAVTRRIPKTRRVADAELRELFKGVNDDERKRGLFSAYSLESMITGREECSRKIIKPLLAYYSGVSIRNGVATVNFHKPAGCYLETTPAMANAVMMPLDSTLKQFKSIKEVQYALDGEVITEWDA